MYAKKEAFLTILEDIVESMDGSIPVRSVLLKVKRGLADTMKATDKDMYQQLQQERQKVKELELELKDKAIDFKKLEQDLKEYKLNEEECRQQMQVMAEKIDERD